MKDQIAKLQEENEALAKELFPELFPEVVEEDTTEEYDKDVA